MKFTQDFIDFVDWFNRFHNSHYTYEKAAELARTPRTNMNTAYITFDSPRIYKSVYAEASA